MNKLYPLKFYPLLKEKIWGGTKMKSLAGIDFDPLPNCGEAWVISGVQGNETVVANGWLAGNNLNELIEIYMDELVGEKVYEKFGEEFPLLIKFIDANDYLSIQVHPDDALAQKRGLTAGKTEMWYIMDADKDSELISGFREKIDKEEYQKLLQEKKLREVLNVEKVKKGDVYYMPSGRVHAIGPGIFLAEIQQTSDVTYRIYDWDRVDEQGNGRELHIAEALDAIDFEVRKDYKTTYKSKLNSTSKVVNSPYFKTNILEFDQAIAKDYEEMDSFILYICVEGVCNILAEETETGLRMGEAVLIPNGITKAQLFPKERCKLLEVFVP